MKNVIITGSTGMVGRNVLKFCLANSEVKTVTSISRRSTGIKNPRLVEVIHDNFLDFSKVEKHLHNQDVCFYCLGVYTSQVSREDFKKITVDFTRSFAEALRRHNDNLTFCFLSGQGADSSEKSPIRFAREKGIAENIIIRLKFRETYIFRPAYIYPVTPREEPNAMYKLTRMIYKPVSQIYKNFGVTSEQLARKIVETGLNGGYKTIYFNEDIRKPL
ncbi:MAG TPA: NAD-dependent epimerase/dehydratase family protein [Spirochaetota bacterium]|nr:NAD-dependent epimerase/dehydratase family protein [Spirochaetota bacterium]